MPFAETQSERSDDLLIGPESDLFAKHPKTNSADYEGLMPRELLLYARYDPIYVVPVSALCASSDYLLLWGVLRR